MSRTVKKVKGLTVKRIAKLLRNSTAGVYTDSGPGGVRGLRLVIKSRSNASWILRFQLDHRSRYMGLGSAGTFGLEKARERALAAREKLADGVDPLTVKHAERAAREVAVAKAPKTFKWCAEQCIVTNRDDWRSVRHGVQWHSSLETFAFPIIGHLPVDAVDTGLVLEVLEQEVKAVPARGLPGGPLWSVRRTTAARLRGRIEKVLGWAQVRGYRHGDNPARWRGHLDQTLGKKQKVEHHGALPYDELPAFMAELRQHEDVAARALEFLILTAARTGEVLGATWNEINFDTAMWTVPATRMKANKEHRVPLSAAAIELLQALYREDGNEYLFVGKRAGKKDEAKTGLGGAALAAVLKRMKYTDVTVHGFRSSFRDWTAERTSFPNHVAEMALAHAISNDVEKAYRRGDLWVKRQRLMEQWARYIDSPLVRQKAGSNVESIAAAVR